MPAAADEPDAGQRGLRGAAANNRWERQGFAKPPAEPSATKGGLRRLLLTSAAQPRRAPPGFLRPALGGGFRTYGRDVVVAEHATAGEASASRSIPQEAVVAAHASASRRRGSTHQLGMPLPSWSTPQEGCRARARIGMGDAAVRARISRLSSCKHASAKEVFAVEHASKEATPPSTQRGTTSDERIESHARTRCPSASVGRGRPSTTSMQCGERHQAHIGGAAATEREGRPPTMSPRTLPPTSASRRVHDAASALHV